MYEVTFIDNGAMFRWNIYKCNRFFGKDEFKEILAGYLPNIVAVKIS